MRMQPWHLIVLLVVVLLVFGAAKLPDITRNLGKSMKIFKQEVRELRDDADTINPANTGETTTSHPEAPAPNVHTTQQGSVGTPPASAPPGDTGR